MKLQYELSREKITLYISVIETVKAPNAFLLGKAVKWLKEKVEQFPPGKTILVTIESVEENKKLEISNNIVERVSRYTR